MKEYFRKPYISKSYADMMKRVPNAAEWERRVQPHSEMEKPYKGDNYSEMQHYYPTNHLPGADYPDMPSGGQPSTSLQWWGCQGTVFTQYSSGDCLSTGGTATVEFKENTDGGPGFGGDPIVDFKADHPLEIVSVSREKATSLTAYVYVTVRLGESTTAISLHVTATTKSGETCTARVEVCPCTCTGISISYTTQQMVVGEQQDLEVCWYPLVCKDVPCLIGSYCIYFICVNTFKLVTNIK